MNTAVLRTAVVISFDYVGPPDQWRRRDFDACDWPSPKVLRDRNIHSFRDLDIKRLPITEYVWDEDAGPSSQIFARYVIGGQCGESAEAKLPNPSSSTFPPLSVCRRHVRYPHRRLLDRLHLAGLHRRAHWCHLRGLCHLVDRSNHVRLVHLKRLVCLLLGRHLAVVQT